MSSLRVQLPWQRSGPGVATTRRHSRVNTSIFHHQQEDAVDDEEEDQQLRLEVPQLASMRREPDEPHQQHPPHQHPPHEHRHHHQHQQQHEERSHHQPVPVARRRGGGGGEGRGSGREGDLDVMSASSWTVSHVHPSASASSQRERRAQIDSCWFNIPDMFMDPASRVAYYWMALVTVAVVYNWIVIILRVAFEDMRDSEFHQKMFRVLDTVCDVIYLLDVAIQSRTAYLEDGCLVKSLPETVRHYRSQPHFPLDVLSVVPLTSLLSYLTKIGLPCHFVSGFNSLTTPGLRILRLLKYPSMTRFFEKTDSRTNNPNVLRAFRLSLHLWLVIHWIGCFYYLLSQLEGLGSNDWVYPNTTEFAPFRRKYIYCMYWSTMTLTTIGERPWPVTDVEYIFTGVTFLIGVFVFAAVVGNVGDVISNMNAARHDFQARMDQIKFYLNHRNIPEPLQDQIKRWAEYTWARTKAIDEHSVLQLLPSRLRTEVAIHVHLKTLKKVRIFEQCEEGLLRELVLKLRPSIYSPGEYICRIGEIGREMYIIDHGKVEILFPEHGTGQMKQVAIMMPGNYFGEISLLKLDDGQNRRTADVRSVGFSELLCLSRRDLMAALMEYPEAKKILEAQARQRILQTKRTPREETEADTLSAYPGHSESGHSVSGSEYRSGRRSARAIFAQVMRQEGFSKLLASTANEELSEMRKILQELREIKSQLSQTSLDQDVGQEDIEEELKRDENLQQIRTQLLLQTGALVTQSNLTSASGSTLTNAADLSSDTSTLTSPTVAQCLSLTPSIHPRHTPSTGKSSARHLPLPLKPSTQYVSPDCMAVPTGVLSKHPPQLSAKATKVLPPYGCFVPPPNITSPLILSSPSASSPEALTVHPRRRRSPPGRVPKSMDMDPLESVDLLSEDLVDMSSLPVVAQCGGGDEPVLAAAEKEPSPKNVEEQRKIPIAVLKSQSSTDSFKESLPAAAFLGAAVGSHSSVEFLDPSIAKPRKHGPKPTALRAYSEPLGPLASSDSFKVMISGSNSSSYTSTSYSTTSTSSGGRGHSPKPAKPRPRYRKEDMPPICTQDNAQNEGSARCLEGTSPSELQKNSNALAQCQDRGDIPVESHLSSDEFAAVFKCSSWNSTDSQKSPHVKVCSSSSLTHLPATEPAEASLECTDTKEEPCPVNTDTENSDCVSKEVGLAIPDDNGASKLHKEDLSSEGSVDTSDNAQEHVSPPTDSCAEETIRCGAETDLVKLSDSDLNPEPADPPKNDGGKLNTVEADDCPQNEEDGQGDCSEDFDDGSADMGDGFIAATRVRSDFDKRVPEKELADIPRTVTCRKIDDSQLTILLARRREANDSVGNVSESPGKQNSCLAEVDRARSEHSHSIQAVIKSNTASHSADKVAYSELKHHTTGRQKLASGNKGEGKDTSLPEANPEQADSRFEADSELPLAKNMPELSANVPGQTDLKAKDVLCDEDVVTDEIDNNKCNDSHMKVYEDKNLPSEMNGRLDESSELCAENVEDEADGTRDGSCTTATPRFTSEGNQKPYPVSILKKTRVQDNEHDENPHRQLQLETHIPTKNSVEVTTETACEEKHSTVCDSEVQGSNEDLSPIFSSAKCLPQICTEDKQEDSLTILLQQQSASQCHDTDSEKRPESEPKSGSCSEAEPGHDAAQTKCAAVNSPRASDIVSASRPPVARRHSEKLDSLIAAFDNGMKFHDNDSRSDAPKNSVVSLTETNADINPDTQIGSKELVETIKEECTEKCTVADTVGENTSPTQTRSPVSPCAKAEDEARTNSTSSSQVGSPQKRKTLKRRHLAKRISTPYEKSREQACPDKTNVLSSDLSTEIASLMSGTESEKYTPPKPPPSENITMCVTLVKNLVWETDSDKKPSSSSSVSQGTPSPLLEEKLNCSSTSLVTSVRPSSKFFFDSESGGNRDSADGGQEVSVEGPLSKCGSPASNRHIASAEDPSVREAVDCFRPGESLDKANNSAVVYSSSMLSSDSSSDCLLTISTCASHLPWRPADPDADLPVREQVCFKASCDAGLSPPSSLPHTLETTEYPQGISDSEAGNTQHAFVHRHSSPSQLTVADEGCVHRGREPVPHTLATHESRLQGNIQADHSNTEFRTGTSPEACTRAGGACTQYTHSSDPTGFDPQFGRTAESRTRMPDHPRQQTSPSQPAVLEARYLQRPDEKNVQKTAQATDVILPHEVPHGEHVAERPKDSRKLKAHHLLPNWLDSPGASSTDESGGDGAAEGEAEAINSFILLSDFGVEEDDDDEGALSGLSGCGDHSDINSDLDDL